MQRNPHFAKVQNKYLFHEIKHRIIKFKSENPSCNLISLGIGDTTEPIAEHITQGLINGSEALGTQSGYSGYGPEQGQEALREKISEKIYNNKVSSHDIFVSDGAKCDIARLQVLFGQDVKIALQDPAYPAYLDSSLLLRGSNPDRSNLIMLPCLPKNNFTPDITLAKEADLIFLCTPNNPTGTVLSFSELEKWVTFAHIHKKIIISDIAYTMYIQENFPRSIYEITGADKVAIEIGSFSKMAGFSGVRLGWTVVPDALTYSDGTSVKQDWIRLITTLFNGASNISQAGGIAALSDKGFEEMKGQVVFYLENAQILKQCFNNSPCTVWGGINAPYLWVQFPEMTSWDAFDALLHKAHIITTPGVGFGNSGEGFLRISGFGHRSNIVEASKRLTKIFPELYSEKLV